jgi:hypothetical protein
MKSVVFTFGRMNPPTTGHQLLVNKLIALAQSSKSTPRVYLSHSVGKKDPLQYDKKLSFARAAFGAIVRKSNSKNIIQILKELEAEKFTHVTMVVGSDRVADFTKLLNTYNGKEYTFEKIDVKSAGERDPDADDVSGMSASKMRALAKDDNVTEFLRGAPNTLKAAQAKNLFKAVRKSILGEDVMEYGHDEKFLEFIFESDMKDDDFSDLPSDSEISKHFDSLSPDDLDLDDSDAMMLDIIVDGELSDNDEMNEARVLNIQQRQKLSQRMKAMSKRLARLRQIKAKQMPAQDRLRMRARKAAIMLLRKRATGKKDLEYSSLSKSQRIAVDTALVQRFGKSLNSLVGRLATRLMPKVRKHAQEYVKQAREEVKEQTFDPKTKKQVPDQKDDNPLNLDALKLNVLTTDPQQNDRVAPDPKKAHLHKNRRATHFKAVDEGRKSSADKDARDAGDSNIVYQMRKTINSRGEHETVFADGHKAQISIADARKLISKFEALRMPADKQEFTIQAGKSLSSFKDVLAHGVKKEKKGVSLGGKSFREFYTGVGRTRTVSPYDGDEPPGTRRVAEARSVGGVEPDANDDPNVSRKPNPKLDLLLRLGLADTDELQKYRRALRSSKKQALGSPEMRKKLADLLDKLIDIVTGDPSTYSRVRYKVQAQEAISLVNKAEKSGLDVTVLAEVFMREIAETNDNHRAFNRVNSFIAGGKAAEVDKDLTEKVKEPTGGLKSACWKGYTAVGMKMKNGRKVPNCVPKEEVATEAKSNWDKQSRFAKYDTIASRGSQKKAYVDRTHTPYKADDAKIAADSMKDFLAKGGKIQQVPPGKKTIKSYVKPKKYMTPNQASRVTEQNMTTHDAIPLSKRVKRVKSFHAFHPPVKEAYTGSEPTTGNMSDPANRFVGTNSIRQNYANVTPGQGSVAGEIAVAKFAPEKVNYTSTMSRKTHTEVDQSKDNLSKKHLSDIRNALGGIRESHDLNEAFAAGFELAPFAREYGITVQTAFEHHPDVRAHLDAQEATYQGRQVPLNKPMKGDVKKSKVFVDPDGDGKAQKVNFGDKKLSIKKDQPARKKSYCARSSGQGNLTKKDSANYWSRKAWDC